MSENMKASGIAWIGDIPESWELHKIKYCSYLKGRIGWQGLKADEFIDEGPYLITGTDFENGRIQFDRSYHISEERYNEAPEIQLKEGDLLVTKDGTVGKIAYVSFLPDKASLNSHLLLIRPLNNVYINKFMFWLMSSRVFTDYTDFAQDGTVMASLSQEKIGNLIAYFPPLPEQTLIADFLDEQCKKIDSIATDIEKQIEILQKYKKSLITETVTKGLNKSVHMKDSGIEWIGDIPEHWEVKRLKYILSVSSGDAITNEELEDGEIPVYGGGKQMGFYNKSNVEPNTNLIGRVGANCGCVTIVKTASWATDNALIVKTNFNYHYVYYLLLSADLNKLNDANAQPLITGVKVGNCISTFVSSYEEQTQIANYLDKQCTKIDSIIESKKEQLTKITQHKKSLIYEYVTGKKRVKGENNNGN